MVFSYIDIGRTCNSLSGTSDPSSGGNPKQYRTIYEETNYHCPVGVCHRQHRTSTNQEARLHSAQKAGGSGRRGQAWQTQLPARSQWRAGRPFCGGRAEETGTSHTIRGCHTGQAEVGRHQTVGRPHPRSLQGRDPGCRTRAARRNGRAW